jgi:hypothetical protein
VHRRRRCRAGADLLELQNKINLTREEYLTVLQIYRGWALLERHSHKEERDEINRFCRHSFSGL